MSVTTWTDEELQAHLEMWDAAQRDKAGTRPVITLHQGPPRLPWFDAEYLLEFDDQTVRLTQSQAERVYAWFQSHRSGSVPAKKSDTSDRDTHFAGFAELLVLQIEGLSIRYKDWPDWRELDRQVKKLIAQRAYDLVAHTILHTSSHDLDVLDYDEIPPRIPDLTAWPEATP